MDCRTALFSLLPFYKTADIIIGVKVNLTKLVSIVLFALLLLGCNSDDATKQFVDPQSFESTQECHVCGMVIVRFPGPKAQAFETRGEQMRKFCSTMEMMIWYLQPENLANVSSVYVHDMTFSPWDKPKDKHLIDAKSAIYVLGSDMSASMGSSLASFSSESAAQSFIEQHGGEQFVFIALSLNLLMQQIEQ